MAKNDMKKNVGETSPRNKSDVTGSDAGLASSGMLGKGVNRDSSTDRYNYNYSKLTMKEDFGLKTMKGNASDSGNEHDIGPSATFDKHKLTISTASQGMPVGGKLPAQKFANPDKINVGNK